MKHFFTIIAVLVVGIATAQPPKFQEVVQVPGVSADALYSRAKEWFAETFVSAQDVVQLDDVANHKLIGKGITEEYSSYLVFDGSAHAKFTIKIECKNGRYRYSIYGIEESFRVSLDDSGENTYQSFENIFIASHPKAMAKEREKKGMRPLKLKKLEKRCSIHIKRYEALVKAMRGVGGSLYNHMSKVTSSEDDNW